MSAAKIYNASLFSQWKLTEEGREEIFILFILIESFSREKLHCFKVSS